MKNISRLLSLFALLLTAIFIFFIIGTPFFTYLTYADEIKDKGYIKNVNNNGLVLYDREGDPFFAFYQAKTSDYAPISEIPEYLQKAVISAEDKNFYENPGFSLRGIARAAYANMIAGQPVQGGSTITQGLVKNQLLHPGKSVLRKYQEITLAYLLNKNFEKAEILEMYLNTAYFGQGATGVKSAAKVYFDKDVKELDLSESAFLAGLLPAPSRYSPLSSDPAIALSRRDLVINDMLQDGLIGENEAEEAINAGLALSPSREHVNSLAPHLALYLRDRLISEFGEEFVVKSGLRVKTTLDSKLQAHAEEVVKTEVAKLARNRATNGSIVVVDPATGEVLVMVGSVDWHNEYFGKVNMALTPRQTGSAFKPVIYAAALEDRLVSPLSVLNDSPTVFQRNYRPRNYDGRFRGPVTVKRALANSLNVPSVALMQDVGLKRGLDMSRSLGMTSLGNDTSKYGLSFVLGAGEVSLLELTGAYAVFANAGIRHEPKLILEVKDKFGKNIKLSETSEVQVMGSDTAFLISSILSDRFARAEMFGNSLNNSLNAAVKTGTTQNFRGALTVGYTPSVAVGVWVGNNDNTPMDRLAGSLGAAPIWKQIIEEYLKDRPSEDFFMPENIERVSICQVVGEGEDRSTRTFSEFVIRGTATSRACPRLEPPTHHHKPVENPESAHEEQNQPAEEGGED
jgi:1A family penicillin-binding protein